MATIYFIYGVQAPEEIDDSLEAAECLELANAEDDEEGGEFLHWLAEEVLDSSKRIIERRNVDDGTKEEV